MGIKGDSQGIKEGFTPDETVIIIENFEKKEDLRGNTLFNTAIDSMLRSSDLVTLRVRDVMDMVTRCIKPQFYVIPQKTQKRQKKPQPVFLSEATQTLLKQYIEQSLKQANDFLFTGKDGKKHLPTRTYRYWIKCIAKEAGIQDVSAYSGHSTRRTLFDHLQYDLKYDLRVLKAFLGHSSIRSTEHYTRDVEKELNGIFRKHNLTTRRFVDTEETKVINDLKTLIANAQTLLETIENHSFQTKDQKKTEEVF